MGNRMFGINSLWHAPIAMKRQQRGSILQSGPISDEMHMELMNETRELQECTHNSLESLEIAADGTN